MKTGTLILLSAVIAGTMDRGGSAHSPDLYYRQEAGQVQTVQDGEVLYVRNVMVEGSKSPAGSIAGGVLGFAVENTIGGGSGKSLARAAGTVVAAATGSGVQEKAAREDALEITVQPESGEIISIVKSADETFDEGDRVRVLQRPDGTARVIR